MNKKPTVILMGRFAREDLDLFADVLDIVYLGWEKDPDCELFEAAAPGADAMLMFMHGAHYRNLWKLEVERFDCPKGIFFQDTHHLWETERKALAPYDWVFYAHNVDFNRRRFALAEPLDQRCVWLPCNSFLFTHREIMRNYAEAVPERYARPFAVFPFNRYGGERDELCQRVADMIGARGLEHDFSTVRISGADELHLWQEQNRRGNITLNLSMLADFNMRNLDAVFSGNLLLTNYTPDLGFTGLEDHAFVFDRDLGNFEAVLDRALSLSPAEAAARARRAMEFCWSRFSMPAYLARTASMVLGRDIANPLPPLGPGEQA
jgi:hypothetical protein